MSGRKRSPRKKPLSERTTKKKTAGDRLVTRAVQLAVGDDDGRRTHRVVDAPTTETGLSNNETPASGAEKVFFRDPDIFVTNICVRAVIVSF